MEKLHSDSTFIWKFVFPWAIICGLTIFLLISLYLSIVPLAIGLILLGIFLFSLLRNMLMNLKFVYLDRTNRQLVVEHKNKKICIPISNIKRIEKYVFRPTQLTIKLKKANELGSDFSFLPRDTTLGWCPPEDELNELIGNEGKETVTNRVDGREP
ncbi:MAG: hypothetical protein KI791_11425 [Cyclobacteriaceae bacterium]|nr:hypothetical protein [Cyclobacteriaceae bacterium SS2]